VIDGLDEEAQTAPIVFDRVRDLALANERAGSIISSLLVPMAWLKAQVELVALPVMQSIAFSLLTEHIFLPMSLVGPITQDTNQYLQDLQSRVSANGLHIFQLLSMIILMLFQ